MGQLGHPYSSMVKTSVARRLKALGASPGKAWGRSAMDVKSTYPKTHAGVEAPMTVSGKNTPKRADRYARGGRVKGKGNTTNIIIAHPGGGADGGRPTPVPVPVPSGMPVGVPPRPALPMAASAPVAAPAGVPLPAGVRPPGFKKGGAVMKAGKWAKGGKVESKAEEAKEDEKNESDDEEDEPRRRKAGGAVMKAGAGSGPGRLQKIKGAAAVPSKTEL